MKNLTRNIPPVSYSSSDDDDDDFYDAQVALATTFWVMMGDEFGRREPSAMNHLSRKILTNYVLS